VIIRLQSDDFGTARGFNGGRRMFRACAVSQGVPLPKMRLNATLCELAN
jgi:hypothetical protein